MKIKMVGGQKNDELVDVQANEVDKLPSKLNFYPDIKHGAIAKKYTAIDEVIKLDVYTLQIVCDGKSERYEYHYQE